MFPHKLITWCSAAWTTISALVRFFFQNSFFKHLWSFGVKNQCCLTSDFGISEPLIKTLDTRPLTAQLLGSTNLAGFAANLPVITLPQKFTCYSISVQMEWSRNSCCSRKVFQHFVLESRLTSLPEFGNFVFANAEFCCDAKRKTQGKNIFRWCGQRIRFSRILGFFPAPCCWGSFLRSATYTPRWNVGTFTKRLLLHFLIGSFSFTCTWSENVHLYLLFRVINQSQKQIRKEITF